MKSIFSKSRNNKLKKNSTNSMIAFLSFSNLINNALSIVSGLLVAKWLLPSELGSFNSFTLITGYVILIQMGIPSGLSRELPFYLGKNDKKEAYNYAAVAQFWQKNLALGVVIITTLIALYFLLSENYKYAAGVFIIGVTAW